jgi:hypothetical protein
LFERAGSTGIDSWARPAAPASFTRLPVPRSCPACSGREGDGTDGGVEVGHHHLPLRLGQVGLDHRQVAGRQRHPAGTARVTAT